MSVNFGPVLSEAVTAFNPTTLTASGPAVSNTGKVSIVMASGSGTSLTSSVGQFGHLAFAEFTVHTVRSRPADITTGPAGNL